MTWSRILHNANRVGPVNLYLHDCANRLLDGARRGTAYPWNRAAFIATEHLWYAGNRQLFNDIDSIETTARGLQPCYTSYYVKQRSDLPRLQDPVLIRRTWIQPRPWVLPATYMHWTTLFQILDRANSDEMQRLAHMHVSDEFPYRQRLEAWARAHPLPLTWLPYMQPDLGAPRILPTMPPLERTDIPDVQFGHAKVSARALPT